MSEFAHIDRIDPGSMGPDTGIWVPSEAVACHRVKVPNVSRSKWRSMVPWLLEESTLADSESLAFVCGDPDGANQVPVIVADREQLAAWQARLTSAATGAHLVPDFFRLPWEEGHLAVLAQGDRWLFRSGRWEGGAGPADRLWSVLSNSIAATGETLIVYTDEPRALPGNLADNARILAPSQLPATPPTGWLGFAVGDSSRLSTGQRLPTWSRVAAACLVLAAALMATNYGLKTGRIDRQASYFEDQLAQGYEKYFGRPYAFSFDRFREIVERQTGVGEAPNAGGPASLAAQLLPVHRLCSDCRVLSVTGDDNEIRMVVAGNVPDAAGMDTRGPTWQGRVEPGDGQWTYRITRTP